MVGLELDPWQEYVLANALGEREDGRWAAFEVGLCVGRQNGKGAILEARELAGLFLLEEERLIIHSAHEFATAEEALERMASLLEGSEELSRQVRTVKRSHGQEGIYLKNGKRLRYKTRTKGGGRGFSSDCLILDEAMVIPETFHGALMPTLSARSIIGNPQMWYTGSAVDQDSQEHGTVFSRVRERGISGDDPALAYFEWSVDALPDEVDDDLRSDPAAWAQANPGLGIRISSEHVEREMRAMSAREFAVERLGAGDWPSTEGEEPVIDLELWAKRGDLRSKALDPVSFAFDVAPDRSSAAIAVAGARRDGKQHGEIVGWRRETNWVADRLVELVARHKANGVVCDATGPAGALIQEIEGRGVRVQTVNAREHAQACGSFFDAVTNGDFRHLPNPALDAAVRGAAQRQLGDAWAWSRKSSSVDISPLVAVTLAAYHQRRKRRSGKAMFV